MIVYDTFTKESREIVNLTNFLKEHNLYTRKNRQTIIQFVKRTKYCLHRFIKEEFKNKIFTMINLENGTSYECVDSNGFLIQIGSPQTKENIHNVNRLRVKNNKSKTLLIDGTLYCHEKNYGKISNYSFCSRYHKESGYYQIKKDLQTIQRQLSNNLRSRIRAAVVYKSNSSFNLIGCSEKISEPRGLCL